MNVITIKDEAIGGNILNEISIAIGHERITIRELIAARVTAEVESYNAKQSEYFIGLVKPTDAEETLNGFRMKKRKLLDAEKQVYIAYEAFKQNGFFILVDDIQAEDLDQEVLLNETTKLSFVKLTPLVGG